jgi:hypothetical protein
LAAGLCQLTIDSVKKPAALLQRVFFRPALQDGTCPQERVHTYNAVVKKRRHERIPSGRSRPAWFGMTIA